MTYKDVMSSILEAIEVRSVGITINIDELSSLREDQLLGACEVMCKLLSFDNDVEHIEE